MILNRDIIAWRQHAPWPMDRHVEQDLLLTRAMVAIFADPFLRENVAMRGGTALHKVHLEPAARYSEDIDLVLIGNATERDILRALRRVLDPLRMRNATNLLARLQVEARNLFASSRIIRQTYSFQPTARGAAEAFLKIEVNCNEREPLYEIVDLPYRPPNLAAGIEEVTLRSYDIDEMLGTKMRALFQREQGRDLFDLWWALTWTGRAERHPTNTDRIVAAFEDYMRRENKVVDADEYEAALNSKMANPAFANDVGSILRPGLDPSYDANEAARVVREEIIGTMRRRAAPAP
jgi:predicted nucleotidyltransferase component of viral defense system